MARVEVMGDRDRSGDACHQPAQRPRRPEPAPGPALRHPARRSSPIGLVAGTSSPVPNPRAASAPSRILPFFAIPSSAIAAQPVMTATTATGPTPRRGVSQLVAIAAPSASPTGMPSKARESCKLESPSVAEMLARYAKPLASSDALRKYMVATAAKLPPHGGSTVHRRSHSCHCHLSLPDFGDCGSVNVATPIAGA